MNNRYTIERFTYTLLNDLGSNIPVHGFAERRRLAREFKRKDLGNTIQSAQN